ncbi:PREDICTED: A disintegrin and metalloproteinase with thrombospondin motifs 4-like, partial [Nicrophorus vespilloides]|uniref:A disintegrin and metalloproteinase with thrombospondin motifs 4-like n=1 Tax=Nicrophorus vespilloides TaxID=110193 RepID=A0ABM1MAQ6_NICVS
MCGDDRSCGLLGMAKLAGICDPDNQAVICQDNGLRLGFTIVHQIGHALGMLHDIDDRNETSIMDPYISPKMNHWSPCSRRSFANFINSGLGACLYDPPTDHSFVLMDALPGVMYDADYQCRELFGPNAGLCMTGL